MPITCFIKLLCLQHFHSKVRVGLPSPRLGHTILLESKKKKCKNLCKTFEKQTPSPNFFVHFVSPRSYCMSKKNSDISNSPLPLKTSTLEIHSCDVLDLFFNCRSIRLTKIETKKIREAIFNFYCDNKTFTRSATMLVWMLVIISAQ